MDPLSIAFIVSMIVDYTIQAVGKGVSDKGNKIKKVANELTNELNRLLAENSKLVDQLTEAYNNSNSSAFMQLANQSALSPALNAARKQIQKLKEEYTKKKEEYLERGKTYTKGLQDTNTATYLSGSSISANKLAEEYTNQVNQAIGGGLKTVKDYENDEKKKAEAESLKRWKNRSIS